MEGQSKEKPLVPVILKSLTEFRERCQAIQKDVTEVTNKSTREMEIIKADLLAKQARCSFLATKVSEVAKSPMASNPNSPMVDLPKSTNMRLAALEDLLRQRTAELEDKSLEVAQNQSLLSSSRDAVISLSGRNEELQQELALLNETRTKEVMLLKEAAKMLSVVEMDRSELEAKLRDCVSTTTVQIADLKDLTTSQAERIRELEANGSLSSKPLTFTEKLDMVGDDVIDKLKDENGELQARINVLEAENLQLCDRIKILDLEMGRVKNDASSKIDNLIEVVKNLQAKADSLASEKSILGDKLRTEEEQIDVLTHENSKLKKEIEVQALNTAQSLLQHQNQVSGYDSMLEQERAKTVALELQISVYESKNKELNDCFDSILQQERANSAALEQQLALSEAKNKELSESIIAFQQASDSDITSLKLALNSLGVEKAAVENDLAAKIKEISSLTELHSQLQFDRNRISQLLTEATDAHSKELSSVNARLADLQSNLKDSEELLLIEQSEKNMQIDKFAAIELQRKVETDELRAMVEQLRKANEDNEIKDRIERQTLLKELTELQLAKQNLTELLAQEQLRSSALMHKLQPLELKAEEYRTTSQKIMLLEAAVSELESANKELEERNTQLNSELHKGQTSSSTLRQELEQLSTQLKHEQSSKDKLASRLKAVMQELDESKSLSVAQLSALEQARDSLIEEVGKEKEQLLEEIKELQAKNIDIVTETEQTITHLKDECSSLNSLVDEFKSMTSALEASLSAEAADKVAITEQLQQTIATLTDENNSLQMQLTLTQGESEVQHREQTEAVAAVCAVLSRLTDVQLESMTAMQQVSESQQEAILRANQNYSLNRIETSQKIDALNANIQNLKAVNGKVFSKVEGLNGELKLSIERCERLQAQAELLLTQLSERDSQIAGLLSQVTSLQSEKGQQAALFSSENQRLTEEDALLRTEIRILTDDKVALHEALNRSNIDLQQLRENVTSSERVLFEVSAVKQQLVNENEQLKQHIENVDNNANELRKECSNASEKVVALQRELDSLSAAHKQLLADTENSALKFNDELAQMKALSSTQQTALQHADENQHSLSNHIASLESEKASLQGLLEQQLKLSETSAKYASGIENEIIGLQQELKSSKETEAAIKAALDNRADNLLANANDIRSTFTVLSGQLQQSVAAVSMLQDQKIGLLAAVERLKEANEILRSEKTDIQLQLENGAKACDAYQAQIENLSVNIAELKYVEQRYQLLQDAVREEMEVQASQVKVIIDSLRSEKMACEAKFGELNANYDTATACNAELEQALSVKAVELASVAAQLADVLLSQQRTLVENEKLRRDVEEANSRIDLLLEEKQMLSDNLDKSIEVVQSLQSDNDAWIEEVESLEKAKVALSEEISDFRQEISALRADNALLGQLSSNNLSQQIIQSEEHALKLSEALIAKATLESQVAELLQSNTELSQQLSQLQLSVETLQGRNLNLQQRNSKLSRNRVAIRPFEIFSGNEPAQAVAAEGTQQPMLQCVSSEAELFINGPDRVMEDQVVALTSENAELLSRISLVANQLQTLQETDADHIALINRLQSENVQLAAASSVFAKQAADLEASFTRQLSETSKLFDSEQSQLKSLRQELAEALDQSAKLNDDLAQQNTQIAVLGEQLAALTADKYDLQSRLQAQESSNTLLSSDLDAKNSQIANLQAMAEETENMRGQLTSALAHVDSIRADNDRLKNAADVKDAELAKSAQCIGEVEAESAIVAQQNCELQQQIAKLEQAIEALTLSAAAAKNEYESELSALRVQLQQISTERNTLLGEVDSLIHRVQQVEACRTDELNQFNAREGQRQADAEVNNQLLAAKLKDSEEIIAQNEARAAEYLGEIASLRSQLETNNEHQTKLSERLQSLQEENDAWADEVDGLEKQIAELTAKVKELEDAFGAQSAASERARSEWEAEAANQQVEIERLRDVLAAKEVEVTSLKQVGDAAEEKVQQLAAEASEVAELRSQLGVSCKEIIELTEKLHAVEEDNCAKAAQLQSLQGDNDAWVDEVEGLEKQITELAARVKELEEANAAHAVAAENEIQHLREVLAAKEEEVASCKQVSYVAEEKLQKLSADEAETGLLKSQLEESNQLQAQLTEKLQQSEGKSSTMATQLQSLQEENDAWADEVDGLEKQIAELTAQVKELEEASGAQSAASERARSEWEAEAADQQVEIERLREVLAAKEVEVASLKQVGDAAEEKVQSLFADVALLTSQLEESRGQLTQQTEKLHKVEAESSAMAAQLQSAQEDNDAWADEVEGLEQQLVAAKSQLTENSSELEALKQSHEAETAALSSEVNNRSQQIEFLQAELLRSNLAIEEKLKEIQSLESQLQERFAELAALSAKLDALATENASLQQQTTKQEQDAAGKVSALQTELVSVLQRAESLQADCDAWADEVDELTRSKNACDMRLSSLESQINQLTAENTEMSAEINSLSGELASAGLLRDGLGSQLSDLKSMNEQLTRELASAQADGEAWADEVGELEKQLRGLKEVNAVLVAQREELVAQEMRDSSNKEGLSAANAQLQSEALRATATIESLRSDIAALAAHQRQLVSDNESLRAAVAALEAENDKTKNALAETTCNAEAKIEALSAEKNELVVKVGELQADNDAWVEEVEGLERQLAMFHATEEQLAAEKNSNLEEKEFLIQKLSSELADFKERSERFASDASRRVKELEEKVWSLESDNNALAGEVEGLEASKNELLCRFAAVETDNAVIREKSEVQVAKVAQLESEVDVLAARVTELTGDCDAWADEVEGLEKEVAALQARISELELTLKNQSSGSEVVTQNQLVQTKTEIDVLSRDLADVTSKLQVAEDKLESSFKQIESLSADNEAWADEVDELEKCKAILEAEIRGLKLDASTFEHVVHENHELKSKNSHLEKEMTGLKETLANTQLAVARKGDKGSRQRIAELEAEISKLACDKSVLQTEIDLLKGVEGLRVKRDELSTPGAIGDVNDEIDNLVKQLVQVKVDHASAVHELAQSRHNVFLLHQQIEHMNHMDDNSSVCTTESEVNRRMAFSFGFNNESSQSTESGSKKLWNSTKSLLRGATGTNMRPPAGQRPPVPAFDHHSASAGSSIGKPPLGHK